MSIGCRYLFLFAWIVFFCKGQDAARLADSPKSPGLVLNEQRRHIIRSLNPTGMEESKNGMNCVLFAPDLNNLEFNMLYMFTDGFAGQFCGSEGRI